MNIIRELLEKHNLFSKENTNWYICHCASPDHEDKNPSMIVSKQTGFFKCMSCGDKGNFQKLLKYLNEPNIFSNEFDLVTIKKNSLLDALSLKISATVKIPPDAIPLNFEYRGLTEDLIKEYNIFLSKEYPYRVCFPLYKDGKVYAIIGRSYIPDVTPKYMTKKFTKDFWCYPMDKITSGKVYLVEGIFDLVAMRKAGFYNTLCTFGCTNKWVVKNSLRELNVQVATIVFDGDKPGNDAAESLKNYLEPEFKVDIVSLPFGVDPGSLNDLKYYLLGT